MPTNKRKVSTRQYTDTKTTVENGVTVKIITTKTIDKFSDGTTSKTKERETHIVRHEEPTGSGYTQTPFLGVSSNSKPIAQNANVGLPNIQMTRLPQSNGMVVNNNVPVITDEQFIEDAVYCHNNHRAQLGVQPLNISSKFCKLAQQWAERQQLSPNEKKDDTGHSYGGMLSEREKPGGHLYSEMKAFNWAHKDIPKRKGLLTRDILKSSHEIRTARERIPIPKGDRMQKIDPITGKPTGEILNIINAQKKAPKAPVTTDNAFLQAALKAHNDHRKNHGADPLTMSTELCSVAQAWVNKIAAEDQMQHSDNGYGENIHWSREIGIDGKAPVDHWYSEVEQFDFENGEYQNGTDHFSQVIWISTKELGIAKATGKSGRTYVVANYNPAGNYLGQYKDNVSKPK